MSDEQLVFRAIADPTRRTIGEEMNFRPIPSPLFPLGHEPDPSEYTEVAPGHLVLKNTVS